MNQSRRNRLEDQEKHDQHEKSSKFDLEDDYSFLSINNHHRPASEGKKNNSIEQENLLKTPEKALKSMAKERTSDSTDENLITLNSLEPELEEKYDETEEKITEKKLKTKNEDEDEGTYEELICLVRQFYVEKPINPAALAHQNIETC